MVLPSSVPVVLLGPVDAGTVVWRQRGQLYLTIAVKGTFALLPNNRMSVQKVDPIAREERVDPSGIGLRTAGDLAPYLGQPEIWLTGHAAVPAPAANPRVGVQLAVMHGAAVRMNKQVVLDIANAKGNPPVIRVTGMGPVSADWPVRSRWLQGIDRRRLSGPVLDIPDALSWEYFQTAPADQRLAALQGDEWVVLGSMVPGIPRFSSQLPAATCAARVHRRSSSSPRAGEAVPLQPDMIQIDIDRLRCSVVWRGRLALTGEAELATLGVAAALEEPGKAVLWRDPFEADRATPQPSSPAPMNQAAGARATVPFSGTTGLSAEALQKIAERPLTPFETADPRPTAVLPPEAPLASAAPHVAGTAVLSPDVLQRIAEQAATPFEARQGATAPLDPFSGTTAISADALQRIAEQLATPFEKRADAPAAEVPRGAPSAAPASETVGLSEEALRKIAEQLATPFERQKIDSLYSEPASPSPPEVGAPALLRDVGPEPSFAVAVASTAALTPEALEKIAELAPMPFEKAERSAPPPAPGVPSPTAYRQITGTSALTLDDLKRISKEVPTPFGMPKNTALTLSELLADAEPGGLGAELLGALAEEGGLE